MTHSDGDPNDLSANLLANAMVAALKFVEHARLRPADSTELRIAKHCFRGFFVGTGAAALAILLLQPGVENSLEGRR
jgi:hypothetical protein